SIGFLLSTRPPPSPTLFPTRRSSDLAVGELDSARTSDSDSAEGKIRQRSSAPSSAVSTSIWCSAPNRIFVVPIVEDHVSEVDERDRKSTRLNSSHVKISYAVFCLKKK